MQLKETKALEVAREEARLLLQLRSAGQLWEPTLVVPSDFRQRTQASLASSQATVFCRDGV